MDDAGRSPPQVAKLIREIIRSGEAPAGAHLGTVELANRFGVSRGPVREALRLLEATGLVRVVPNKGAFVVALEDQEVRDLLAIREVLFALLAQECAAKASDSDIALLEESLGALETLALQTNCSARDFQRATGEFVGVMYRTAGIPRLKRLIQDLSGGATEVYGHLAVATREMRMADLKGYQRLVKALRARSPTAAFQAARSMHGEGVARAIELSSLLPRPQSLSKEHVGRRRRAGKARQARE